MTGDDISVYGYVLPAGWYDHRPERSPVEAVEDAAATLRRTGYTPDAVRVLIDGGAHGFFASVAALLAHYAFCPGTPIGVRGTPPAAQGPAAPIVIPGRRSP